MFLALHRILDPRPAPVPVPDARELGRRLGAAGVLRDPAALDPDSFACALAIAGIDVAGLGDDAFAALFGAIAGRPAALPAA
ncbi:MAG: hypothetical protein IT545_04475 [Rhodobacteraceae bacterium]|nr:hypothetical protein [Paracoccaceae bacterium]